MLNYSAYDRKIPNICLSKYVSFKSLPQLPVLPIFLSNAMILFFFTVYIYSLYIYTVILSFNLLMNTKV